MQDTITMSEVLLRIIPTESLAEDAMLELVECVEAFIASKLCCATPVSLVAQVALFEPLNRLTAIVQYGEEAITAAMLAVRGEPCTVADEDRQGQMVQKRLYVDVVTAGREADSGIVATVMQRENRPALEPTTLLLQREWGLCSFATAGVDDLLKQMAELALRGWREATEVPGTTGGQTVELASPMAQQWGPVRKKLARPRTTVIVTSFRGVLTPPPTGMRAGWGYLSSTGVLTIGLSPEPLHFAPQRGARRHAQLSVPGWRLIGGVMISAAEAAAAPRRVRRGQGKTPVVETFTGYWESSLGRMTDPQRAQCVQLRDGGATTVRCPFWVVHVVLRGDRVPCAAGRGCRHPDRGGALEPCSGAPAPMESEAVPRTGQEAATENAGTAARRWEEALAALVRAHVGLLRMRAPGASEEALLPVAQATVGSATRDLVALGQVERMQGISALLSATREACTAERQAAETRDAGRRGRADESQGGGSRSRDRSSDGSGASES
jgi:hypothetical protein